MKYQRFTTLGSKDIGIIKSEFVANTQFLWNLQINYNDTQRLTDLYHNHSMAKTTKSMTTVRPAQLQVIETYLDSSMNRNTEDTEQPDINREEIDCLASTSGAALYSADGSIQGLNLACDQEQL